MMILSGPNPRGGADPEQLAERVACLEAACRFLRQEHIPPARLAQALLEPAERWGIDAFESAGFLHVGELAYMRRPLPGEPIPAQARAPIWPEGISVRNVGDLDEPDSDRPLLLVAMDRSYVRTLDCPELCGLRDTADVLESHRATGDWDPHLWWLVFLRGEPHGCLLLNRCPEQRSVELVYLGLSPELRGKGLGAKLLALGLAHLDGESATHVACAVDVRNAPALALYTRLGFTSFTSRIGYVRRL
jgi:mycothiol synthase